MFPHILDNEKVSSFKNCTFFYFPTVPHQANIHSLGLDVEELGKHNNEAYSDDPILAKNWGLFSVENVGNFGLEIEGTGEDTSSNRALPCLSC